MGARRKERTFSSSCTQIGRLGTLPPVQPAQDITPRICRAMEGLLADTSQALILDALTRATCEPAGVALLSGKANGKSPGLFAATAAGKKAAKLCKDQGLLQVIRAETKGRGKREICAITDKGRALLQQSTDPVILPVKQVADLPTTDHDKGRPEAYPTTTILAYLDRRQESGRLDDCPLPELFAATHREHAEVTIGSFHDLLRKLHREGAIHLHPWTGPLYEMPEPSCALLVGHEIAYYASLRLYRQSG